MVQVPDFVFDVVTCVNKHSYMRLEELKDFLISLGVKGWRLFTIFPVGVQPKILNFNCLMRSSEE